MIYFGIILFVSGVCGLKTWIPNTDMSNKLNWDLGDIPQYCDNIYFPFESEVTAFWDLKELVVSGLSLPGTGDIMFSHNVKLHFKDKKNCPKIRDITYMRNKVKSWLDPFNWKSDSEFQWLPHAESVPCAGENVLFPVQKTFSVQLPSVLLPLGKINFDNETFGGEQWSDFLNTHLGYQLFSGPEDLRSLPWRDDIGCFDKKKCICSRSAYTIRNGLYKEASPGIFEKAVCLYAMPKCKPVKCYSPVLPEGHCCGICGAIIKLEDKTEGLKIPDIKGEVQAELEKFDFARILKTYVGRTKDGNLQIVIVAEQFEATIQSHIFASIIRKKFADEKLVLSSHTSGLTFSNYVFNSVSGIVFGTLLAVIILFISIFYLYVILPKKKVQKLSMSKSFLFARFDNSLNYGGSEENLEINIEAEKKLQAFDNPIYTGSCEPTTSGQVIYDSSFKKNDEKIAEVTTKEYTNPVYETLEKSETLNFYEEEKSQGDKFEDLDIVKL